jgi:hypothetical protein
MLHILRSAVLNSIEVKTLENAGYDAVVICIHGFFYWREIFFRAFDRFLNKFSTTMFITFIDDFRNVLGRLNPRPQWQGEGRLTEKEILLWQNVEVEVTALLAQFADRPFFAVPTAASPHTFYKLAFHPEIEPVYIAMPISHFREPEQRKPIDEFIVRLDKYFTVFNPLSVEVVGAIVVGEKDRASKSVVHRHVVFRDQYWFVAQCDKIIVYWPKLDPPDSIKDKELRKIWPTAIASPGVNHESKEAFTKTKDVWVVFRGKEASPFLDYHETQMFFDEESFFKFLDSKYPERKNLTW